MKPGFRVSIFFKIKNKNLWVSLCSPAPHTPWPAPSEARVFPLGRCGGWGWRGGSLDSASPTGVEPGFCPLGGRRKVPSWVHVARANSHPFSHSLAHTVVLHGQEEGRGPLHFLPVQVARTSLTRPAEAGGRGGQGGFPAHQPQHPPSSALCFSLCLCLTPWRTGCS